VKLTDVSEERIASIFRVEKSESEDLNWLISTEIDSLLGNDSVNTFSRTPTRATIGRLFLGNRSVKTPKTIKDNRRRCFPWGPPRGYITNSSREQLVVVRSLDIWDEELIWVSCCQEFGRILQMAVQGDWEEMTRKELRSAKRLHEWFEVTVRLLYIRCQDTTCEGWKP
jgi:hypothetical protein